MILSNITNPILAMVDTAIVGHLDGSHYLAGTAVAGMLITQIYWLCGFLRMSATGLSAQALGSGENEQAARIFYQLLAPAGLLGLLLILLQGPLQWTAEYFAEANLQVRGVIYDYLHTRIWGAPAALANLVLMGWLIGQQMARSVLAIQVAANLLNALLSLWLALGLEMGVKGVAMATVLAEWGICLTGSLLILRRIGWLKPSARWFSARLFTAVLRLNGDILLRNLALQLTLAWMVFQGARLGEQVVAVNAILMQFFVMIALGLDGIAYAVEALVGESKGRKDSYQLHLRVWRGLLWSSLLALIYSLAFVLFDRQIVALLTDLPSLRQLAGEYLQYIGWLPLAGHWCFLLDGVFIGLTRGRAMRNSMLLCSLGVFLPVWWWLSDSGNHALWSAFLAFLLARGVSLGWVYWRLWSEQALLEG
ncbi:MATE family efflux transporter [Bowmanella dokdonensis]|uniref:MATE family efflux transporter n=1 Tax=Bowmanella dokdonensis TaxID=751969 RepID=A0A939IMB3_9ALTE|nr:MATE family efflux transporter [Bowmanella dokdonensis]MBN7823620.1 MATE family efflux transporter [Bowmanella dokdonensis]